MDPKHTRLLLTLLFTGTLMGALDLAIIGPALPVIQDEFGMAPRALSGLLNAYVLLQMVGALLLSKLADRMGARTIYIASIGIFALGSLVVVLSENAWMLYAGRGLQGFGSGGIFPAAAAVIGARLEPRQRGQALGVLGMVWGMAFLVGPLLGGILLRFSWQWLFAINLPIAAILIVGAMRMLPADKQSEPAPFDLKGMFVLMAAMGALMTAVTSIDTNAPLDSLLSWPVGGGLLLLIVLLGLFWKIEHHAGDPIVRPELFASPQITKSCIISLFSAAIQAGSLFLPALLVLALDIPAADAALLLLPGVVAATVAAPLFGRMINRTGTRFILVISQILVMVSLAFYAYVDMSIWIFIIASSIGGIGNAGLVGAPIRFIVLAETTNHDRAAAQGLLSVVGSVGRLLGAAMAGAIAASKADLVVGYQAIFVALIGLGVLLLITAMTLKSKADELPTDAEPQKSAAN